MRSPSQTFYDLIVAREFQKAKVHLAHHGAGPVQAALWIALGSWAGRPEEAALLDATFEADIPGHAWTDAFLRRLAISGSENDPILTRILEHADAEVLGQRHALHHAAFHGRSDIFDLLGQKLEATDQWKGWDEDIQGLGTPLYLAMREMHPHAIVALLQRNCEEDRVLQKGTLGADGVRTAQQAARMSSKHGAELDSQMAQIKLKVKLEGVAKGVGRILGKGAEAVRKIRM